MMQTAQQQTGIWDTYYAETDPERREELLSDGCETEPDDGLNELRRSLWNLRYTDPKDQAHRVDQLLWQCVNLLCVFKMSGPRFLRKNGAKEVCGAMRTMGFEQAEACGEAGKNELYREFRNAAQRYFSISQGDKSYRKKYFGIVSMNSLECREKLAKDAWRLSEGVKDRFSLPPEMELFCKAIKDEFFASTPDAQLLWDRCSSAYRKK